MMIPKTNKIHACPIKSIHHINILRRKHHGTWRNRRRQHHPPSIPNISISISISTWTAHHHPMSTANIITWSSLPSFHGRKDLRPRIRHLTHTKMRMLRIQYIDAMPRALHPRIHNLRNIALTAGQILRHRAPRKAGPRHAIPHLTAIGSMMAHEILSHHIARVCNGRLLQFVIVVQRRQAMLGADIVDGAQHLHLQTGGIFGVLARLLAQIVGKHRRPLGGQFTGTELGVVGVQNILPTARFHPIIDHFAYVALPVPQIFRYAVPFETGPRDPFADGRFVRPSLAEEIVSHHIDGVLYRRAFELFVVFQRWDIVLLSYGIDVCCVASQSLLLLARLLAC
mmetsp:Transcript_22179/g.33859  ORF Transcript_22179/g.33859 Transcript_22179/m.33859 type:complete len:340 (-) Transcript_22179:102-1121(-)